MRRDEPERQSRRCERRDQRRLTPAFTVLPATDVAPPVPLLLLPCENNTAGCVYFRRPVTNSIVASPPAWYHPSMKRPRPKYQVFISSTFTDLKSEREAVTWAILESRHIPAGMENFSAADDRGWGLIQRTIDTSDYYVLVLAGRYGSYDPDAELSWTHREYRYAREKGIPVLAFFRDSGSITSDKMESTEEQRKRLVDFTSEVRAIHHFGMWKEANDLRHNVIQALRNQISDDEDSGRARPGWFRGDELPSAGSMDEFARLSAEAAELRRQVAEHSARRATLSFAWEDTEGDEFILSRKRFILERPNQDVGVAHTAGFGLMPGGVRTHFGIPAADLLSRTIMNNMDSTRTDMAERLAKMARKFPLSFVLRNKGVAASRNITVDIEIDHAQGLDIFGGSYGAASSKPWQIDPQEHSYVERWSEPNPKKGDHFCSMRQRIRLVAPGGEEILVRATLYLADDQTDVAITYKVRDEEGNTAEGSLRGSLEITETREVSYEEAQQELK